MGARLTFAITVSIIAAFFAWLSFQSDIAEFGYIALSSIPVIFILAMAGFFDHLLHM